MDTDSSCFVPLTSRKSAAQHETACSVKSVETDYHCETGKGDKASLKTEIQKEADQKKDDSFHVGSLKWAKYKKKEKGQKT